MSDNEAGWQPDPTGKHDHRYWDGSEWTENVSDAGVASTDPYDAAEAAAPDGAGSTEPTGETPVGDTTDSYPTATPPPPQAPPPYAPPSPIADGGGDGGSKRGLVIGGAILAAVAIAVVAFLALGGDDDPSARAELASALQDDTDLSDSEAECVADLLVDEAGEDAFEDTDFSADDPPPEFIAAFIAVGPETFVDECGVDESTFGGSDGSTDDGGEENLEELEAACADGDFGACDDLYFASELGSDLEEFGSTCGGIAEPQEGLCETTNGGENEATDEAADGATDGLDGNFEDILTDTYQQMFGISEEKARCLAEQISGAVQEGELTEEQMTSEIFDYLEACDISLEEISGG